MKRRFGMLVAVASVAGLLPASVAMATSGYMGTFNTKYGTTGTRLDTCSTCHRTVPDLNGYGRAFRAKLLGGMTANQALTAIHTLDSDRDTFTNLREIRARTFPGRRANHP